MGAYVHSLSLIPWESLFGLELEDVSVSTGGSGDRGSHILTLGGGGAPGIGTICVSSTRRLWPPPPCCVCAVEDGPVGGL